MKKNLYEKENFSQIVKKSKNFSDVAINLGLKPFCGNRQTIKKYINLYDINISHFAIERNKIKEKRLNNILISGSTYLDTTKLKNRLYKQGLKERKCEKCGQNENWHGEHMSLILDHINGINNDNRLNNLRILCPNCNATLPTHGGKNIKIKYNKIKHIYFCKCGNKISNKSDKCTECSSKLQRKVERPSYKQLKQEINEIGYLATSKKYGISDNAIRKWIKFYEKHK